MSRRSKKKQNPHSYIGSQVYHSQHYVESGYGSVHISGDLHREGVSDVPIHTRGNVMTRLALLRIPDPQDGDAIRVELYRETWLYYNGSWHCTVAPEEAHRDPDRKDLLVKCLAWGP